MQLARFSRDIREFKIYDATVTKTSLKIASSSLLIFFAIVSVCVILKASRTTQELNLEVQCQG